MIVAPAKRPASDSAALFEARRLRRDDADVEVRQIAGVGRRRHVSREVVLSADPEPVLVEFAAHAPDDA